MATCFDSIKSSSGLPKNNGSSNTEVPARCTCYRVYLTIAVHVSGIIITHLQEHKTTVTTASGNRYTVLLSVVIVEELEPV